MMNNLTRMTWPTKKFDDIFSRVDKMHQRDRWRDGQTDTGQQQRPRTRITSYGKKETRTRKIAMVLSSDTYKLPLIVDEKRGSRKTTAFQEMTWV